jgi:O-antigen/teichoic acid export membrane protein
VGQSIALATLAAFVWWLVRKGDGQAPVRHSLFESAPSFWIITLASFGNDSLGILLLGMLGSVADAGIFGVAARLALPLSFLSASVQAVYEPRFAGSMRAGSHQQLRQEFRTSLKHSFALAAAMLVVMAVLAEALLLLFGSEFGEARTPFVVMLAGLCVMAAFGPAGSFLAMTGKARYNAWIALAALPAAVILHALLIPSYGALGAACATTAVLLIRTLVQAWAAFRHLNSLSHQAAEREPLG